jgi:hypothetical protein
MNPSISNTITINPSLSTSRSTTTTSDPSALLPYGHSPEGVSPPYPSFQNSAPPAELPSSSSSEQPSLEQSSSSLLGDSIGLEPPPTEDKSVRFQLALLKILQNVLASDFPLLQNIIEQTKNIILRAVELFEFISLLCSTTQIDIISEPVLKGCSSSENVLYYKVERIVVNGFDLMIAFNNVYNTLKTNHISLEHVIPSECAF